MKPHCVTNLANSMLLNSGPLSEKASVGVLSSTKPSARKLVRVGAMYDILKTGDDTC